VEKDDPLDHIFVAARYQPFFWRKRPWIFYLINDRNAPIERVCLVYVGAERGDHSWTERVGRSLGPIKPRSFRKIWCEDSTELHEDLLLELTVEGKTYRRLYEFPRLQYWNGDEDLPLMGGKGFLRHGGD
jgi:hypothetical protein